MPTFDASSIIHAWDEYAEWQFPPLWDWMAAQIRVGRFSMPDVAFGEVKKKYPECATWLEANNIQRIAMSNEIVQEALRIKTLLDIQGDNYHPDGVGENDIFIIAAARIEDFELVSNEKRQINLPKNRSRMKIPAVCALADVAVPCLNFVELIKRSGEIFR